MKDIVICAFDQAKEFLLLFLWLHSFFCTKMLLEPQPMMEFLLDPSHVPELVDISPQAWLLAIQKLMATSQIIIWRVHKSRMKTLGLSRYL